MGTCTSLPSSPDSPVSRAGPHSASISVQSRHRHLKGAIGPAGASHQGDTSNHASTTNVPVHLLSSHRSTPSLTNVPYTPPRGQKSGYTRGGQFTNSARRAPSTSGGGGGAAWADPLAPGNCSPTESSGGLILTFPPGETSATERHTTTFQPQRPHSRTRSRINHPNNATVSIDIERSMLRHTQQQHQQQFGGTSTHGVPAASSYLPPCGPGLSRRTSDASVSSASPSIHQPSTSPRHLVPSIHNPEPIDCTEIETYYDEEDKDYQEYCRKWEAQREADERPKELDPECLNGRSLFFGLQIEQHRQKLIHKVTFEPPSAHVFEYSPCASPAVNQPDCETLSPLLRGCAATCSGPGPEIQLNGGPSLLLRSTSSGQEIPSAVSSTLHASGGQTGSSQGLSALAVESGAGMVNHSNEPSPRPLRFTNDPPPMRSSLSSSPEPRPSPRVDSDGRIITTRPSGASGAAESALERATSPRDVVMYEQGSDQQQRRFSFTVNTTSSTSSPFHHPVRLLSAPLPVFTVAHIAGQSSLIEFMRVLKAESQAIAAGGHAYLLAGQPSLIPLTGGASLAAPSSTVVSRYSSPHFGPQSTKLTPLSRTPHSPQSSLLSPPVGSTAVSPRVGGALMIHHKHPLGMIDGASRTVSPLPPMRSGRATHQQHAPGQAAGGPHGAHHMRHTSIA